MQISKNKVVSIHYTLKDNDGVTLDSSLGGSPLMYIQGIGSLIPGMEEGLEGKSKGDKVQIHVTPEKGYGLRDENLVQQVPRSAFGNQDVEVGMRFRAETGTGVQVVTVTEVTPNSVTVDGNHPLAGVDLYFTVEVMDVRQATPEELAHGHVHDEGNPVH
jgi:FKBP-type peptidyl-prolyl cis-trans isomerase SlyD